MVVQNSTQTRVVLENSYKVHPTSFFNVTLFLYQTAVVIYIVAILFSNTTLVCVLFCTTIPTCSLHFHEIVFCTCCYYFFMILLKCTAREWHVATCIASQQMTPVHLKFKVPIQFCC